MCRAPSAPRSRRAASAWRRRCRACRARWNTCCSRVSRRSRSTRSRCWRTTTILYVCLTDDQGMVIATTRRAWLGREIAKAVAEFDAGEAARAVRERHARVVHDLGDDALLSYAGILMGRESEQLRPS